MASWDRGAPYPVLDTSEIVQKLRTLRHRFEDRCCRFAIAVHRSARQVCDVLPPHERRLEDMSESREIVDDEQLSWVGQEGFMNPLADALHEIGLERVVEKQHARSLRKFVIRGVGLDQFDRA